MAKKTNTLKDLKALYALDVDGLKRELTTAQKELYILRMKHVANELKQPHLLRTYKKQVARIQTLVIQSEIQA